MKTFKSILIVIGTFIFLYLGTGFIIWEFDPATWVDSSRYLYFAMSTIASAVFVILYNTHTNEK